jgi:uncharacterized membrane protein
MSHNGKERMSRVSEDRRVEDETHETRVPFHCVLYSEAIGLAGMAQKRSPCFRRAAFIAAVARAMREDPVKRRVDEIVVGERLRRDLGDRNTRALSSFTGAAALGPAVGRDGASREARATTADFTNSRRGGSRGSPGFEGVVHDEHDAGR